MRCILKQLCHNLLSCSEALHADTGETECVCLINKLHVCQYVLQGHVFVHSVWLTQGERPRAKSQKVAASAEYINESLSFYSSKHGQVFSKVSKNP